MRNATIDTLLAKGLIHERDGKLLESVTYGLDNGSIDDKLDIIKNMTSSEHSVIVVAWPKTGNHFLMAILDALGLPRVEDVPRLPSGQVSINGKLFEAETDIAAYAQIEAKMAEANGPIILPHTHMWPCHFMTNFKGKILMITETRNPWHFRHTTS